MNTAPTSSSSSSGTPSCSSLSAGSSSGAMDDGSKTGEAKSHDKATDAKIEKSSMGEDSEETSSCPLFMDGLPSDFASNDGLAAIACLLNDDGEEEGGEISKNKQQPTTVHLKAGSGKVKKTRVRNNHSPYHKNKNNNEKDKKMATIGEAQLFLNMWKI